MSVLEIWDRGVSCFMIIASQLLYIWWLYEYFLKLWEFLEFLKLCKIVIVAPHGGTLQSALGPGLRCGDDRGHGGTEEIPSHQHVLLTAHNAMIPSFVCKADHHSPLSSYLLFNYLFLITCSQRNDVRASSKYDILVVTWMRFRHMRPSSLPAARSRDWSRDQS